MAKARVGAADLYYELHGRNGDPAVFVHGSLEDHRTFERAVPRLAQSLQLLLYDRRGYGESGGPIRTRAVRDDAADLAGLLEAENFYPVHLVAHSYGGAVALRLAVDRPELVRSLALHEPPFAGLLRRDDASAPEAERLEAGVALVRRAIADGRPSEAAAELVGLFADDRSAFGRLPAGTREEIARYVDRWDEEFRDPEAVQPAEAELGDLLLPVLLTVGEQSPRFVHRIVGELAALLPNASVHAIHDAGHSPHLGQVDQYAGLLVTFLLERNVPSL
jgi:pimeloyl-ACP methyl ester carboxylesterase